MSLSKRLKNNIYWGLLITFLIISAPLFGQESYKSFFVFSPDGKYLVKVFLAEGSTFVRVHDTGDMHLLTKWQIPGFQSHTIQFSEEDPSQLLIADNKKLLLYHLKEGKQQLSFVKPEINGQEIEHATFDRQTGSLLWSTKNTVYKTNTHSKKESKIGTFANEPKISSITSLDKHLVAASFEGKEKIILFSSESNFPKQVLTKHKAPVIGVLSLNGQKVVSLDESNTLMIQDIHSKKVESQVQLSTPSDTKRILAVGLDDLKDNVVVIFDQNKKRLGQAYSIHDLAQGVANAKSAALSMTPSGKIYTTFTESNANPTKIPEPSIKQKRLFAEIQSSIALKEPRITRKKTLHELAQIESDNGNYEQALEFIRKIKVDDSQYRESRELQKEIFALVEQKDILNAAIEQYQHGDFQSAKVLLERIRSKGFKSKEVEHYLDLIADQNFEKRLFQFLIVLLFLLIIAFFIYYILKKRSNKEQQNVYESKKENFSKESTPQFQQATKDAELRRSFILLLDECKQTLRKALKEDETGKVKEYLDELTSELNRIEKKAKSSNEVLPDLMERLQFFQERVDDLRGDRKESEDNSRQKEKNGGTQSDSSESSEHDSRNKQNQRENSDKKQSKIPNYYKILDVPEKAKDLEIKNAYRKRMKEYHPDRHNSTDFDWIKKEAAKMTQLVQEAYETLSDPQKRSHYDQQINNSTERS